MDNNEGDDERTAIIRQIGFLYCKGARAPTSRDIARIERKIDKLKKRLIEHGNYFERVKKLDKDYKDMVFNLVEHGNVGLTEIEKMSLMQRIEYQNFIVNKIKRENRGRDKHKS